MLKGLLPSRRVPSGDFTFVTPIEDQGKENQPNSNGQIKVSATKSKAKKFMQSTEKKKKMDAKNVKDTSGAQAPISNEAFDKLLDDLQIPSTLRPKLYGMDSTVKAAMIKSSQTMAVNVPVADAPATPEAIKGLRRAHSTESLITPHRPTLASLISDTSELPYPTGFSSQVSAHHSPYLSSPQRKSSHSRGTSLIDPPRFFSKSQVNLIPSSASTLDLSSGNKITKDKTSPPAKNLSPTKFCSILTGTSSTQLDVEDVKKLRLFLRNETASWSEEFLNAGGYTALLTRLNELLEVEWREEQHDDQVLHEILRCFKALSTSSIGSFALRSSVPTPFLQLVSLLYSDKKPGDVATRQLIVELLLLLFELYPPNSLPSSSKPNGSILSRRSRPREPWESQASLVTSNLITLPTPHKSLFSLIRTLLLTPAPPPSESPKTPVSPHAFIESLHLPRIYKTYLKELSDLCRDYFWVFCHPNNTIWILDDTNETSVERPRAPGGMTGGVEAEAMGYFTTHLKFINAISKCVEELNMPKENELSTYRFHTDLFLSGFERIIVISRKASTTYYPSLHLELARYIAYATRAGYELPYTVGRLVGKPPDDHAKVQNLQRAHPTTSGRNTPRQPKTPTHRGSHAYQPSLPSPRKLEPLRFE